MNISQHNISLSSHDQQPLSDDICLDCKVWRHKYSLVKSVLCESQTGVFLILLCVMKLVSLVILSLTLPESVGVGVGGGGGGGVGLK